MGLPLFTTPGKADPVDDITNLLTEALAQLIAAQNHIRDARHLGAEVNPHSRLLAAQSSLLQAQRARRRERRRNGEILGDTSPVTESQRDIVGPRNIARRRSEGSIFLDFDSDSFSESEAAEWFNRRNRRAVSIVDEPLVADASTVAEPRRLAEVDVPRTDNVNAVGRQQHRRPASAAYEQLFAFEAARAENQRRQAQQAGAGIATDPQIIEEVGVSRRDFPASEDDTRDTPGRNSSPPSEDGRVIREMLRLFTRSTDRPRSRANRIYRSPFSAPPSASAGTIPEWIRDYERLRGQLPDFSLGTESRVASPERSQAGPSRPTPRARDRFNPILADRLFSHWDSRPQTRERGIGLGITDSVASPRGTQAGPSSPTQVGRRVSGGQAIMLSEPESPESGHDEPVTLTPIPGLPVHWGEVVESWNQTFHRAPSATIWPRSPDGNALRMFFQENLVEHIDHTEEERPDCVYVRRRRGLQIPGVVRPYTMITQLIRISINEITASDLGCFRDVLLQFFGETNLNSLQEARLSSRHGGDNSEPTTQNFVRSVVPSPSRPASRESGISQVSRPPADNSTAGNTPYFRAGNPAADLRTTERHFVMTSPPLLPTRFWPQDSQGIPARAWEMAIIGEVVEGSRQREQEHELIMIQGISPFEAGARHSTAPNETIGMYQVRTEQSRIPSSALSRFGILELARSHMARSISNDSVNNHEMAWSPPDTPRPAQPVARRVSTHASSRSQVLSGPELEGGSPNSREGQERRSPSTGSQRHRRDSRPSSPARRRASTRGSSRSQVRFSEPEQESPTVENRNSQTSSSRTPQRSQVSSRVPTPFPSPPSSDDESNRPPSPPRPTNGPAEWEALASHPWRGDTPTPTGDVPDEPRTRASSEASSPWSTHAEDFDPAAQIEWNEIDWSAPTLRRENATVHSIESSGVNSPVDRVYGGFAGVAAGIMTDGDGIAPDDNRGAVANYFTPARRQAMMARMNADIESYSRHRERAFGREQGHRAHTPPRIDAGLTGQTHLARLEPWCTRVNIDSANVSPRTTEMRLPPNQLYHEWDVRRRADFEPVRRRASDPANHFLRDLIRQGGEGNLRGWPWRGFTFHHGTFAVQTFRYSLVPDYYDEDEASDETVNLDRLAISNALGDLPSVESELITLAVEDGLRPREANEFIRHWKDYLNNRATRTNHDIPNLLPLTTREFWIALRHGWGRWHPSGRMLGVAFGLFRELSGTLRRAEARYGMELIETVGIDVELSWEFLMDRDAIETAMIRAMATYNEVGALVILRIWKTLEPRRLSTESEFSMMDLRRDRLQRLIREVDTIYAARSTMDLGNPGVDELAAALFWSPSVMMNDPGEVIERVADV